MSASASEPESEDHSDTIGLQGRSETLAAEESQDQDSSVESECAICFDVAEQSASLPCLCRVTYCLRCWDRSLAQSFNSSGQARCPTCRAPVRVDFDASAANGAGQMLFSKDDVINVGDGGASFQEIQAAREATVERLAAQAAPVMSRNMQLYGDTHPFLRPCATNPQRELSGWPVRELKQHLAELGGSADGCLEKSDLIKRLVEAAGDPAHLAAYLAGATPAEDSTPSTRDALGCPPLRCVCGDVLQQTTGRKRMKRFFCSMDPSLEQNPRRLEAAIQAQISSNSSSFICDICEAHIPVESAIWSCGNGEKTILHATAYDVCNACFLREAVGFERC